MYSTLLRIRGCRNDRHHTKRHPPQSSEYKYQVQIVILLKFWYVVSLPLGFPNSLLGPSANSTKWLGTAISWGTGSMCWMTRKLCCSDHRMTEIFQIKWNSSYHMNYRNLETIKMKSGHESVDNEKHIYIWHGPTSFPYIGTWCPLFFMPRIAGHISCDSSPCKGQYVKQSIL